jgi:tuberous sclerosis 1
MIDYFAHTNSFRVFEVLVKVQTPHDIHIFNKLQKYLQEPNQLQKKTAICLFGQIVRRPPTWLHKIVNHSFHKELLKMLKVMTLFLDIIFSTQ